MRTERKPREPMDSEQRAVVTVVVTLAMLLSGLVAFGLHGANNNAERDDARLMSQTKACAAEGDITLCMLIAEQIDQCNDLGAEGEIAACLEDVSDKRLADR